MYIVVAMMSCIYAWPALLYIPMTTTKKINNKVFGQNITYLISLPVKSKIDDTIIEGGRQMHLTY